MNAILYARFSPRPNAKECESIDVQLEHCRRWCERKGHTIIAEFNDRKLSGADYERPGLWRAIGALQRDSLLVVYKFDRLARDGVLWVEIERQVAKHKGSIVSASGEGSIEKVMDPAEWLKVQMIKVVSEYEAKMIRFRTSMAMRRHQAAGRKMSNRAPFGWKQHPTNPTFWTECPTEQAIVARILDEFADGAKYREIARMLNDEGVPCRGHQWHHTIIVRIVARAKASMSA